ncbi:MAG: response regulator [Pirellulaceae bacterium]
MLVLSRNRESGLHIGPDITVKVLSINRQAVKLGIEAPQSLRVWRDELAPMVEEHPAHCSTGPIQQTVGMRIVLVVEDDPGHAKLIRKALCQQQGTMVTVAGTAGGALDALGARSASVENIVQPDLVLLDLGLPDGSGLDVLRTIRSVPELRTAPVVVLSCSDDETVMQQCMEAGANAFVVKSASYDDFRAMLGRISQFWAGDCFAKRSFSQRGDDLTKARSDDAATIATGIDELEEVTAGTDCVKRILLADDGPGHVTLIQRALRRASIDCAVDVVHNGVEAIDYLFGVGNFAERKPATMPDLILLDLNMPEMNGRQVLQVLRNARGQELGNLPPIVVLTSSDEETDINDSYKLGAQSFIRKPVDHGRFMEAVQQTTRYWLRLNESRNHDRMRSTRMNVPR